jgi:hypothetical protein
LEWSPLEVVDNNYYWHKVLEEVVFDDLDSSNCLAFLNSAYDATETVADAAKAEMKAEAFDDYDAGDYVELHSYDVD